MIHAAALHLSDLLHSLASSFFNVIHAAALHLSSMLHPSALQHFHMIYFAGLPRRFATKFDNILIITTNTSSTTAVA